MKIKIWNPFIRAVPVRYWRAEAYAQKREKTYVDNRFVYFEAATPQAAAKGLRMIMLKQSLKLKHAMPVTERHTHYPIPIWSLAYWLPSRVHGYMVKKGYFSNEGNAA